jgi:hypothetical protein
MDRQEAIDKTKFLESMAEPKPFHGCSIRGARLAWDNLSHPFPLIVIAC